ncbi:HEAT repeat domain-containing protein [Kribbella sp. NBC_00709]|uniref:HEAT repeat domain-containing protein n=1 Tax=Kribbella sp. NBC_00709 TaxID=2975972 RepID=UPI002E2C55A3|nr:HEAT repeat domain-containing protein [Kribbella sp. NBC_00709]
MRASDLLRAIDQLSYGDRLRRVALEGRRLRGTAELGRLLDDLGRGTPYERTLGATIAQVAVETGHVTRLLNDPMPAVQHRALAAVGRGVAVSDDDLRILYDDAPAVLRTKLLQIIRKTGRSALAARLIDDHRERWGDRAAAGLLAGADGETVERLLSELAYILGPGEWERLGSRHPKVVLAYAHSTLPSGPDRDEWWQGTAYGVAGTLEHDPAQVAALLTTALPPDQLPSAIISVLGRLMDADPAAVLRMLLAPERAWSLPNALTPAVRRRLYRYSDDDLIALGRLSWPILPSLLGDLPPSRRAAVFDGITSILDLGQVVLSTEVLALLPRRLRFEQARRMLTVAAVAESNHLRWQITAFLPYDEAFALLEPEITQPDADDRGRVYRAIVESAGHSRQPADVEAAVSWATRSRNDRDTVRQAVLRAVSKLPPSTMSGALTGSLETLLSDALDARDTSWGTQQALNTLAITAVQEGARRNDPALVEWGLQAHGRLTENQGSIALYRLIEGLPRGRETAVYDVLRRYVDDGVARKEFRLTFAISRAFDERGWSNAHLQAALEQAVWSNQEYTVAEATELWLWPSKTRGERVERIITRDAGMARWDPVWQAVTEVRTDLLDAVLAHPGRIRRFDRNHPAWQVSDRAIRRWLPRQQERYAELVAGAADDERMPDWARANAVSMLGHVPHAGRAALEPFLTHESVLLQEAALGALAWTEAPQEALPVLLAHAGDDRARVAIYAATRAALFVRPSRLPGLLHPVLVGEGVKITSRKEAARLLGKLRAPGASAVLADAWASAHRDVKAAIASAASQYLLHEPASWALLQQAVHDSAATATVLTQRPAYGMASKYRARYADLLVAVTNRPEPEVVRSAVRSLPRWARWNPAVAPICVDFIADLSTPTVWNDAITALVAIDPELSRDEVVRAARLLVRLEADPRLPDALADRDHPAGQRLEVLVKRLSQAFHARPDRQILKTVAAELDSPDLLWLRLELLVDSVDWHNLETELRTLVDAVEGRPLAAYYASSRLGGRLSMLTSHWTPELLEEPARTMLRGEKLMSGLVARSLIGAAGQRTGWAPAWRELLVELRNHPHPDVRHEALNLKTATEV